VRHAPFSLCDFTDICTVKNDLSIAPLFDQLLKLHEPDRLVGYIAEATNPNYEAHNQLQRQLAGLFPNRRISLEQGQFYAQNDMTAHALHVQSDDDLRTRRLAIQHWTSKCLREQLPLAIYGAIYPGQEEFYTTTIQMTDEDIEIGSKKFWESQISSDPFASVINLTAYNISAYKVTNWFESNEFDIVVGEDINSICMYWNFRATRDATHISSKAKRRTILAPHSALEDRVSQGNLIEVVKGNFPTPGISSNLNIVFSVWDEESRDRLSKALSQSTEQLERLTGEIKRTHHFGREGQSDDDLAGKKLTYLVRLPMLPELYCTSSEHLGQREQFAKVRFPS
jgi:hypothetical protein